LYPTAGIHGKFTPLRAKGFVLLLRYSGMRVGDAATLRRDKIQDGRLFLYTGKKKTPVYVRFPHSCLETLEQLPKQGDHFFWSGNGTVKAATAGMQRTLTRLFRIAGIENGHCHRFRDTFAISLLDQGVTLHDVAILLGNTTRIAEK